MTARGTLPAVVCGLTLIGSPPDEGASPRRITLRQEDATRSIAHPPTASLSADGRWVAFTSRAALNHNHPRGRTAVYVWDRVACQSTLESRDLDGQPIQGDTGHPRLSGDGRYLVFEHAIESPAGPRDEVLLRDRQAGTITRVSQPATASPPDGWSGAPAISADGVTVAFVSSATNLVEAPDENGKKTDVYIFRVAARSLERISVAGIDRMSGGASVAPSVSGEGRFVAFTWLADQAANDMPTRGRRPPRPSRRVSRILVHDTLTRTTRLIAHPGRSPERAARNAAISADGRWIAFVSERANVRDLNGGSDVFLYDMRHGISSLVSRSASGGPGNGRSDYPALTGDGRFVAFQSDASDLFCRRGCSPVSEDINLLHDVFLFDRVAGTIARVSDDREGGWLEESGGPALSGSGNALAFSSRHPIRATDLAHDFDLFVHLFVVRGDKRRLPGEAEQIIRHISFESVRTGGCSLRLGG